MPRWDMHFDPHVDFRSLVELIVEVEARRRSVMKIPLPPHVRREFDRLNIIRQIKGTTGIEGNTLSAERIGAVVDGAQGSGDAASREEREVLNAHQVSLFIKQEVGRAADADVTEELIRTLHGMTTDGCDYPNNVPGRYRQCEVAAGDYIPPDHQDIPGLMERLLTFINSREVIEGYKAPIRAILAHFYLVSIHPFGDGNGRTSRALEAYILYQAGYNVRGFYSLANFLYQHRDEYIRQLQAARFQHQGNLTPLVEFCLRGFTEELSVIQDEILNYIRSILFQDLVLTEHQRGRINDRGYAILEHLRRVEKEGVSEEMFKTKKHYLARGLYQGLTDKTLQRDLKRLQTTGFIAINNGHIRLNMEMMDDFS